MTILSYFRRIYSLDTLDTRLTTSTKIPARYVDEQSTKTAGKDVTSTTNFPPGAQPSKWRTVEFRFYALAFILILPQMYKAVWDVSQPTSPQYSKYKHLLSPGWMFGRKVDNSDGQYASFRDNVPALAVLLLVHPVLRRVFESLVGLSQSYRPQIENETSSKKYQRFQTRLRFDFWSGIIYVVVLHGFSSLKVLTILYVNYTIAMSSPRQYMPAITWVFNIAILFANELYRGYQFSSILEAAAPFYADAPSIGKFLDSYGGLNPRWEVLFNISVLRLISFNIDYAWSQARDRVSSPIEASQTSRSDETHADALKKKQLDHSNLSERDRVSTPAPDTCFHSFQTYVGYILYPPLYLAGPILTFNDYISQSQHPSPSLTVQRTILYAIRFVLTVLCMEFILHTIYVVAISKSNPDWSVYSPFQLAMLGYFNLHIIWLKLLIPWRFFRLWALIDGIDPIENVVRCMSDNYSALSFWRAWHRSFNRWIVRYLYVPLGGGAGGGTGKVRGYTNILVVFTFVALWHDINLQLLAWGWLVVFFILPEVLATMAFPARKWKDRPNTYRVICGVGAVFNILMMMAAHLVGFAVGLDGLKGLVEGIAGSYTGIVCLLGAMGALFIGAQVMFEHREEEKRKGIFLKY